MSLSNKCVWFHYHDASGNEVKDMFFLINMISASIFYSGSSQFSIGLPSQNGGGGGCGDYYKMFPHYFLLQCCWFTWPYSNNFNVQNHVLPLNCISINYPIPLHQSFCNCAMQAEVKVIYWKTTSGGFFDSNHIIYALGVCHSSGYSQIM